MVWGPFSTGEYIFELNTWMLSKLRFRKNVLIFGDFFFFSQSQNFGIWLSGSLFLVSKFLPCCDLAMPRNFWEHLQLCAVFPVWPQWQRWLFWSMVSFKKNVWPTFWKIVVTFSLCVRACADLNLSCRKKTLLFRRYRGFQWHNCSIYLMACS